MVPSDQDAGQNEREELRQRVRLLVAYDGSAFHGFARNRDVVTVAGELERHLRRILRHDVVVTAAGRTDRGVHAWGQVVSFDTFADRLEPARLQRSLNGLAGPAIAVREVQAVGPQFDARFSAIWRRYRYTILTSTTPNPFLHRTAWHLPGSLSVAAMNEAGAALVGTHDFSSFCRRPPQRFDGGEASLVRTLMSVRWAEHPDETVVLDIVAKAFCHQMVRAIVGTLVDVGLGERSPSDMAAIIAARDRARAGDLAPPHGLCLYEVGYPDGICG